MLVAEDTRIDAIKDGATEILAILAEKTKQLNVPVEELALFDLPSTTSYRVAWTTQEVMLLIAPAADLPSIASYTECETLFLSAVLKCRELAAELAGDAGVLLRCGTKAPQYIVDLAEKVRGNNLPIGIDCLAVEVVRQAFLYSGEPVSTGVPALRAFNVVPELQEELAELPVDLIPAPRIESIPLPSVKVEMPEEGHSETMVLPVVPLAAMMPLAPVAPEVAEPVRPVEEMVAEDFEEEAVPVFETQTVAVFTRSVLIAYEGSNTRGMHKGVKKFGANWCKVMEGTWIVKTDLSVNQVRAELAPYLKGTDRLFIAEVGKKAAWQRLGTRVGDWIKNRL